MHRSSGADALAGCTHPEMRYISERAFSSSISPVAGISIQHGDPVGVGMMVTFSTGNASSIIKGRMDRRSRQYSAQIVEGLTLLSYMR
jgi:hypothetical protein